MKEERVLTTLGKICEASGGDIQTGPFGSQLHASDYVEFGIPSIMPQNIDDNRVTTNGIARISKQDAQRLSRYLVKRGDIIYSRRGDVERRALIREREDGWLCGTGCLRIRFADKAKLSPEFISFYLGTPTAREWIVQNAVGATMPNLNTGILSDVPILLPSYEIQIRIASLLGSLDDKMELNRRMNEALEAMAQAIFKDWFVDFGPVRRKAAGIEDPVAILGGMIDDPARASAIAALFPDRFGENGLPEGWENVPLNRYVEVRRGGSPRPIQDFMAPAGLPWMKISDATSETGPNIFSTKEFIKPEGLRKTVKLPAGSLILSNSATPGLPKFLRLEACIHDGWLYFPRMTKFSPEYLYLYFLNLREFLVAQGNGSIFTNLKIEIVNKQSIVDVSDSILDSFQKAIEPLFEQILNSQFMLLTLSETRDYLLPKLMSGEIRVRDAEALIREAAE